ncbi:MAG: Rrf2 family transcriptional regulator [Candidatus Omnitrophota bacterium]
MKLTSKSVYGVRALINLAVMYGRKRAIPISLISREEGISSLYLEQIFNKLKNYDIIKSVRGPKGGYAFAKDPEKVSVYEVIAILEDNIFPGKCVRGKGNLRTCRKTQSCVSKEVWQELAVKIEETLKGFTFKDLANRAVNIDPKEKCGEES